MSGVPPRPSPCSHNSSHLFFLYLLFLLSVAATSTGQQSSVRDTSIISPCYSFDCGDGVQIRYPLWNSMDSNTTYCGYLNLGIECQGRHPVLKLGGDTYQVADVRYNTSTIILQDRELLGSNCPRARHNLTLQGGVPLEETEANGHLLFFFNCSASSGLNHDEHKLSCLSRSGSNDSYIFQESTITTPEMYMWAFCRDIVKWPVLKTVTAPLNLSALLSSFGTVLHRGFELKWQQPSTSDCMSCERVGGSCGYSYNKDLQGLDFLCLCNDGTRSASCSGSGVKHRAKAIIIGIATGASGFVLSCFIIFYCWHKVNHHNSRPLWIKKSKNTQKVEAFLEQYGSLVPKRYGYAEVKKITKSFSEKLGQGAYGTVFKGKLSNGLLVAVKVLSKFKGNGEDFINEVASIGRTHHVNVVSLLGFCFEGSKRALIYEFMHNGSLDKLIFSQVPRDTTLISWDKLYGIAIGIARGLEYLHHGCNMRIVHFDIKPHNILLDEDFCPKISDFGLAKSCHPKQSILSLADARGTIGYIAPEVFSRSFGVVSSKSDVYSYGMMVLEMVGGRRNSDVRVYNTSETYFPHWIYEHFDETGVLKPYGVTTETEEIARKMTLVGLWCIQTLPSCRPSMSEVVEMLEGNVMDLQMPPKPYLSSPLRSNTNSPTQSTS